MSQQLADRLFHELEAIPLIDPHTHINPHAPASKTLADIMGYHYYTELAHSAGMPRAQIEGPGLGPKEKVRRLVEWLGPLDNTIQVSWLMEMCGAFFDFHEDRITPDNWEALYDAAAPKMAAPDWESQVLDKSRLEQVFLTNDFDDPLTGFDTPATFPACGPTTWSSTWPSRPSASGWPRRPESKPGRRAQLGEAIGKLFEHFTKRGARRLRDFAAARFRADARSSDHAVDPILKKHRSEARTAADEQETLSRFVFWTLAEQCAERRLPFDLMIGVNRGVYEDGVYQGQDLFDSGRR